MRSYILYDGRETIELVENKIGRTMLECRSSDPTVTKILRAKEMVEQNR